jgi:2,3-bisphosphoglycerate-independent phosphoglycerate mutase
VIEKVGPEHILFVFIDGLGIGYKNTSTNPCGLVGLKYFNHFQTEKYPKKVDSGYAIGLDATLGIGGLPQSATGQTALLTGKNSAVFLGRHLSGFPNEKLRGLIAEHSILKMFVQMGQKTAFLNTFRPPFFDYNPFDIIHHLSVTSVTNLYAGLPFFDLEDLIAGRSVYQDLTNESLIIKKFKVPLYTPEQAGEVIGRQSQNYRFCLFEYFQTDRAGHSQNLSRAHAELVKLERFLDAVLSTVDLRKTLVLVTSDHGNIEDLSVKSHTRNPVLALIFGNGRDRFLQVCHSITDFYPVLLSLEEPQTATE